MRRFLEQAVQDLLPVQVIYQSHRRRPQRRVDRVLPDHGNAHVQGFLAVVHTETNALQPHTLDIIGPQVGFGTQPVEEDTRLRTFGHFLHPGIIVVQNGHPIRRQGFDQLRLAPEDGFLRPGAFGVHGADVGHHADLRAGDVAQQGNLAGNVETHFKHGPLVAFAELQNGERQTDLVVHVASVFQRAIALAEHFRHNLFRGGFAHATGNADHFQVQLAAPEAGNLLESSQAVLDQDAERHFHAREFNRPVLSQSQDLKRTADLMLD